MTESNLESVKEENIVECRACLQEINSHSTFYHLFDCVEQMGSTIAEKLSNIAHVQILENDELPKVICDMCYTLLQTAHSFSITVQKTDELLRQKFIHTNQQEKQWPKPIQISSNIPQIEIKEEVLTEEECFTYNKSCDELTLDIKVESDTLEDEFDRPKINGVCSLNNMEIEYLQSPYRNGDMQPEEDTKIKEESQSAEEIEPIESDLSLDCMLCTKSFKSVTGLKAHVITQHSYKGVKRKSNETDAPSTVPLYICQICKRSFTTSTDLMVHETCHNKCTCYICSQSQSLCFNSSLKVENFKELSKHRLTCSKMITPMADKLTNTTQSGRKETYTESNQLLEVNGQKETTIKGERKRKRKRRSNNALENLNAAVCYIDKNKISFTNAERIFGIPRRSIAKYYRKINNGGKPLPSYEEDSELFVVSS